MNRDDQPPYTENEQIILNCARELIYAMRLLRNAVSSGDERTIVAKIAYMRMQLRWLRSIDRALSKVEFEF